VTLPNYAYFRGKIVPYSEAKVGVMTHALNYGTAAFGGVRGYWNTKEEQLFVFRPIDHFRRLLNSGRLLCAEIDLTPEQLRDISLELLRHEGYLEDCYIRPLIYKADEIIGVKLHDLTDEITMFSVPFSRYVDKDEGAHVTFSSWRRWTTTPCRLARSPGLCELRLHQDRCPALRLRRSPGAHQRGAPLGGQRRECIHDAGRAAGDAPGHREHPGGDHPPHRDGIGQGGTRAADRRAPD
jgi:hypothetical protein